VCVRGERFKLVRSGDGRDALFDLDEDPEEERDASEEHPAELDRLRTALDRELASWVAWGAAGTGLSDDHTEEIERHLAELGYL
jgi:hypothetical protein